MKKREVLLELYENKININKAYKSIYNNKKRKRLRRARYIRIQITVSESRFATILLKTIFFLPIPIWLLKIFMKNSDQVISESFPMKIKDLLKHGIYREMFIKVNSKDGTKVLIKSV